MYCNEGIGIYTTFFILYLLLMELLKSLKVDTSRVMVLVLVQGPGHRMCINLSVLLVRRYSYVVQTLQALLDNFLAFMCPKYHGLNMVTKVYGCQMSYSTMRLNLIQVRRRRDQNVLRVIWQYKETRLPSCAATVLLASM